MSGLVLTLKESPRQRVDLSPLTPDRLRGLDAAAIGALPLIVGNRRLPVGELFTITPGDAADLTIANGSDRLDCIGRAMTNGTITVEGDAGAYLGLAMQGGRIVVHGSAGAYAAAALRSGIVEIDRAAGDFLGGALAGEMKGMSGGLVIVRGSAGSRAADRMRRGTIIVEGGIGGYAGSRMIAGTIIVLGEAIGPYPGYGMKRGTLVLRRRAERELPSFTDCGRHDLGFLRLLLRALHGRSRSLDQFAARPAVAQRLVGDLAAGGQGEILLWQP